MIRMHNATNGQFNNSFLLDEVRCGFYVPSEIKQAWAAQLEVLQAVNEVCRNNGIQYFADWGTLLGTVRHRGFIPWDDDIDIVMKREDYEHFRRVEEQLPEGFSIHTFRNEEGFREFHATVVGAPSVSFEKEHLRKFHGFPYLCGLDIFILDYVYADEKREDERVYNIKYVIAVADAILDGGMSVEAIEIALKNIENKHEVSIDRRISAKDKWILLYELAERICGEVAPEDANELTQMIPWGVIGKNFRFDKRLYEESIDLPFEYTYMPVPMAYDDMLKKRYGDYLKINKAAGGHGYPFFEGQRENLIKLLDFDMPGYRYSPEVFIERESRSSDSWKSILLEATDNWQILARTFTEDNGLINEDKLSLLANVQQVILDIGNFVEELKGENCFVISVIEKTCETIFRMYSLLQELLENGQDATVIIKSGLETDLLSEYFSTVNDVVNAIDKLTSQEEVLFIVTSPRYWNRVEPHYKKEILKETTDVYLMPIPYYFKDYDGTKLEEVYENSGYPSDIDLIDYNKYEISLHHPDRIYFFIPFDEYNDVYSVDSKYYSNNLRVNTDELIYVPWYEAEPVDDGSRAYQNLKYIATMPGIINADKVIIDSANDAKKYSEKLAEWSGDIPASKWIEKFEIFNKSSNDKNTISYDDKCLNKKLLYYLGNGQVISHGETAIKKIRQNLEIFSMRPDRLDVVVVVEDNFIELLKVNDPAVYEECKAIIDEYANKGISWKLTSEFAGIDEIVDKYDAYYGDACYLVPEMQLKKKPIMIQSYDLCL